jgi:hypothetical protein
MMTILCGAGMIIATWNDFSNFFTQITNEKRLPLFSLVECP